MTTKGVREAQGTISGRVTDNVEVAELRVDGKLVAFRDGAFQWQGFVPPSGKFVEVVVVDDGSTDETWQLLSSMACKESRLRVFRQD